MARTGKIARLPQAVREELNRRLHDGEGGAGLLAWLNGMPAVQTVLAATFGGGPVSDQNLSQWRKGGYQEWLVRREMLVQVQETAAEGTQIKNISADRLGDHLATVLLAEYACTLHKLGGKASPQAVRQLQALRIISREVAGLRRSEHGRLRVDMQRDMQELFRERTKEEVVAEFKKWLGYGEIKKCVEEKAGAEREQGLDKMFGMTESPAEEEGEAAIS